MALQLPRAAITTRVSSQLSHQLKDRAIALGDLALVLSTEWDQMGDQARIALARKIQRLSLELGQLIEWSGLSLGPTDPEAGSPWFDGLSFLTPRQHEVLRALAMGASTKRIGQLLGVSTATVRSHVKSVLAKLGVHSRVEAVALLLTYDARLEKPA